MRVEIELVLNMWGMNDVNFVPRPVNVFFRYTESSNDLSAKKDTSVKPPDAFTAGFANIEEFLIVSKYPHASLPRHSRPSDSTKNSMITKYTIPTLK